MSALRLTKFYVLIPLMLLSFIGSGQENEQFLHEQFKEEIQFISNIKKGTAGDNAKAISKLNDRALSGDFDHQYLQDLVNIKLAELNRVNQTEKAEEFLKLVKLDKREKFHYLRSLFFAEKGYLGVSVKDCDNALNYFERAMQNYDACNLKMATPKLKSYILNGKVHALICLNRDEEAMELLEKMDRFVIKQGLNSEKASVYSSMGYLHNKTRNHDEAIKYYTLGLSSSNTQKDSAMFLGNLGAMHFMNKQLDSSAYYMEISLEMGREGPKDKLLDRLINLGALNLELKKPEKSLKLGNEAIEVAKGSGFYFAELKANELKANALYDLEQYDSSLAICNRIIPAFDSLETMSTVENLLQLKGQVLIALNKPELAAEAFQQKSNLMDSLSMYAELNKLQETMIKYETSKKEQKIQELEHAKKIAELKSKNEELRATYLTFGIIALALVGAYIIYYQRQRSNRKKKEMLLKISKSQFDPHFLNNAFGTLQSLFISNSDPEKSMNYVNKLSRFSRLILESRMNHSWSLLEEENANKHYLSIQQFRLKEDFSFQYEQHGFSERQYAEEQVPTALLQSILENCLDYNIEGKKDCPHIQVTISKKERHIVFKIITSGGRVEIDSEAKEDKEKHESRGMSILRERLKLFYGKSNYSIDFNLLPNKHSSTIIIVKTK